MSSVNLTGKFDGINVTSNIFYSSFQYLKDIILIVTLFCFPLFRHTSRLFVLAMSEMICYRRDALAIKPSRTSAQANVQQTYPHSIFFKVICTYQIIF